MTASLSHSLESLTSRFTTNANGAAFTTVMVRTEFSPKTSGHASFSLIIVPTNTPGYTIVRETPVLGITGGHCEVVYNNVRVPAENLLGERGAGFLIAQERLAKGRCYHAMRWLGQAQRAFDLMCQRLHSRHAFGEPLAKKQLMQKHVFDSYADIQSCRLLVLSTAVKIDRGDSARVEIATIKVVGANMLHRVVDRAIQVYGAAGLTDDTPLSYMYRAARFARIYDGPDEVHTANAARAILSAYGAPGASFDFGLH
eukprot:TRINITY_DN2933_c0_g1_i1.p1 TRINITY_DN2933_c0_g1~~TRINITY_DN2933_c0_g1_i1.p1  ORF type:complete len:256 (+),score=43.81 TRINITY_DN2933_c0_g1_i1:112-879(+)